MQGYESGRSRRHQVWGLATARVFSCFLKFAFQEYTCRATRIFAQDDFRKFESAMELWCLRSSVEDDGEAAGRLDGGNGKDEDDDNDDDVVCIGVGKNGVINERDEMVDLVDVCSITRYAYRALKQIVKDIKHDHCEYLRQFRAQDILADVCWHGVRAFEKQKCHEQAVDILKLLVESFPGNRRMGKWYVRLLIDLKHLGRSSEAAALAERALADARIDGGDRITVKQFTRLNKENAGCKLGREIEVKLGPRVRRLHVYDKPTNRIVGVKSRFISYDDDDQSLSSVERLVIQHFGLLENGSWHGIHCEGRIFRFLFGLMFWDIIFADDIPGVFQTPFQNAPWISTSLDNCFTRIESRKIEDAIANVQRLTPGDIGHLVMRQWHKHYGKACIGVYWEGSLTCASVALHAACMGGGALGAVLRTLSQNYYHYSGGAPDVFLWKVECRDANNGSWRPVVELFDEVLDEIAVERILNDKDLRFSSRFVEVKGPRDRLSDRQISWLNILSDAGDAFKSADDFARHYRSSVCYIIESEEKVEKAVEIERARANKEFN